MATTNKTLTTTTFNELLEKLMVAHIKTAKPDWPAISHINALDAAAGAPRLTVPKQQYTFFTVWFDNGQEFMVTVDKIR